ncbi:hypothetical protein D3C73_1204800 [compost metagenome]
MAAQIRRNDPVIAAQQGNHLLPISGASAEAMQQDNNFTLSLIAVTNIASFTTHIFHDGFLLSYVVTGFGLVLIIKPGGSS